MISLFQKLMIAVILLMPFALAAEPNAQAVNESDDPICAELVAEGASSETLAKRGCCSWHKGVCGCSGGRVQCCDGSLSPSCTCHKEDTTESG